MSRFTFLSLRVRLLLLVLLAVLPALGLILYTAAEQRQLAAAQTKEDALRLVRQASSEQEQLIKGANQFLAVVAQIPAVRNGDTAACNALFIDLLKKNPFYANIGLINRNGDLLCSAIPFFSPINLDDRAYFQRTLQTRGFAIGDYQIGRITDKPTLHLSYPVLNEAGQVQAVLFAALDLTWLNNLAADEELPPGAILTVIDRNGTTLARYPDSEKFVGKAIPEAPVIQAVLRQQGKGTYQGAGADGAQYLFAFSPLYSTEGEGGVYIITGTPSKSIFADANRRMVHNLAGLGLVTALVFIIAWTAGNLFLLRRLKILLDATQRLAAGDLSARTGLTSGRCELEQLGQSFDKMAAAMEQRTDQLEATNRELENEILEHKRTKKVLERLYRQNELILSSAGEGIFGIDRHGRTTFVNPAAAKMLGFEVEELIDLPSHAIWRHSEADGSLNPKEKCPFYAAYKDGTVHHGDGEVFCRKNGTIFPVECVSSPIVEQDELVGAVVVFKDVSERKQAEDRIRSDAARASALAKISQALAESSLDYQVALDTVARLAAELIGDCCFISLLSDDGRWLNPAAFHNPNPEALTLLRNLVVLNPSPIGEGMFGRVVQSGQPLLVPVVSPAQAFNLVEQKNRPYLERYRIHSILIVPLRVHGRVIGMLSLLRDYPGHSYTPEDQAFLQDLADRVAQAIASARLYSENQRQLQNLSALYTSAQKLGQSLNLQELAEDATRTCVEVFGADLAWLGYAEATGSVRLLAQYPQENNFLRQIKVRWDDSPLGQGAVGRSIRTNSPVIIPDIGSDLKYAPWRKAALEQGFCCTAGFPLISRDKNFGALLLYSDQPGFFTQERVHFFQAYAHQAAAALENARLFEEADRRIKNVQALRNIDRAIAGSLDLRVTFNVILDQVINRLDIHAAVILLLNPHTQTMEYAAGRGFRSKGIQRSRLRLGEGYSGRDMLENRIISIPNLPEVGSAFLRAPLLAGEDFIAYCAMPLITKGQVKGLLEIFHRNQLDPNQDWLDFLETLAGQAAIAIDNAALFDDLQRSNIELTHAYNATIEGLSYALDLRDKDTEGHSRRVTEMTLRLARAMGMREGELIHVRWGALLHDIGKLGISDDILLKRAPLTEGEWEDMRHHPVYAYEMLSPIDHLRPALDIPYCHHEKWDGTGYPRGLKGEQIPLAARIFAVVDVWDALSTERPYRPAWSEDKVREYIRGQAGKYFDPKAVDVFLKLEW